MVCFGSIAKRTFLKLISAVKPYAPDTILGTGNGKKAVDKIDFLLSWFFHSGVKGMESVNRETKL